MLKFFDADDFKGTASIYESHITFNKPLLTYMKDAYRVRVGADTDNRLAYVFLYDKDKALNGEIKPSSLLSLSVSKTYCRICSRSLIDYLKELYGFDIKEKSFVRFKARYDETMRAVVIDLKEAI